VTRGRIACAVLAVSACAGPALPCDSSSCLLVTRDRNGVLSKGAWRVDLSGRRALQDQPLQGGTEVFRAFRPKVDFERERLVPFFHLDEGGREHFVQADAAYGLTDRTTVIASFPLLARRSYVIGHPPFFETFTTEGNGDLLLGVRRALGPPSAPLVAGLSLKVPTGTNRIVSINRGDTGILDPMLQPGTGSVDAVASLQYGRTLLGLGWTAAGSYQRTTRNGLGYRFGDESIGALSAGRRVAGPVSGSLQFKLFHKARSRYLDQAVGSTGSTLLYLTPGLRVAALRRTTLYAYLQLPVRRRVNETQLAPRRGALVGISQTF
jgi:hypothetical protein